MVQELGEVFGRATLPHVHRLSTKRSAFVDPNCGSLAPPKVSCWLLSRARPLDNNRNKKVAYPKNLLNLTSNQIVAYV